MARYKRSTSAASAKGAKRPAKTMTTREGNRKRAKIARKVAKPPRAVEQVNGILGMGHPGW